MPGAKELFTVEWQSAHVIPSRTSVSLPLTVLTVPRRPTTALSLSSVTVVAGLLRSTWPALIACATAGGIASASTFKPTLSARDGLTELCTTSCIRAVSVQNFSSPKVSKRKICFPSARTCADASRRVDGALTAIVPKMPATTPAPSKTRTFDGIPATPDEDITSLPQGILWLLDPRRD